MKDRDWLIQTYKDPLVADQIIESKKDLQKKRGPNEPQYTMANPDLPDSEESLLKFMNTCTCT